MNYVAAGTGFSGLEYPEFLRTRNGKLRYILDRIRKSRGLGLPWEFIWEARLGRGATPLKAGVGKYMENI